MTAIPPGWTLEVLATHHSRPVAGCRGGALLSRLAAPEDGAE